MLTYTGRRNLLGTLIKDTTSSILSTCDTLMNNADRYLVERFYLDERTGTTATVAAQQAYTLPYNWKKMVNVTITVGTTIYSLQEAPSRAFWDTLNYVTYSSDVPAYWYAFNGQLLVYPTPASSSNTITFIYKIRPIDLTEADYTTGTVALTNGSTTVTGSGTTFTSAMAGRWIKVTAPSGDGAWYQIASFTSTTVLVLSNAYAGTTVSGASYTLGQVSLIPEQYQDLPVYKAAEIYFTTQVIDPNRAALFKRLYDEGYKVMEGDIGAKTTDVRIRSNSQIGLVNPNLFLRY